ncbi:MAG: thioredoxin family protein [Candidatus Sericytochromatia bacterium]
MFRFALRAVGAVCLLGLSVFPVWQTPVSAQAAPAAGIQWVPFEQALQKAKSGQKHVYIQFHATWCGYCKKLEKTAYTRPDIQKLLNETFVPVRIVENSGVTYTVGARTYTAEQMMARYKVAAFPTFVFLKPDGSPVGVLPGYLEPAEFKQALQYVARGDYQK